MPTYQLLSIDPGLDGTGWALWERGVAPVPTGPSTSGLYVVRGDAPWDDRVFRYAEKVHHLVASTRPDKVVIEQPMYMQSAGGQVTAASGALVKLTYLAGSFGYACRSLKVPVELVTPPSWKGQLSKQLVERRITQLLREWRPVGRASHVWDAVGIGLHALGVSI